MGRMPVTSDARLIRDVATAPATAFKKPESEPSVNELPTMRFVVEAMPLASIWKVEVAEREEPLAA
jgi:hypothetical protein